MREWRKANPVSEEERRKDNCRSYTNMLIKRGRLQRKPCYICGAEQVQAHHPDYSKPAVVVWLCKEHHRNLHRYLASHA